MKIDEYRKLIVEATKGDIISIMLSACFDNDVTSEEYKELGEETAHAYDRTVPEEGKGS